MLFTWLKKIFGLSVNNSSSNAKNDGFDQRSINSSINKLEEKMKIAQKEKENIKQSDYSWFSLIIPPKNKKSERTQVFTPRILAKIPTLRFLKSQRLQAEADEQKRLENNVNTLLDNLNIYLSQKKEINAKQTIEELSNKIVRVKDLSIKERYNSLQRIYLKLQDDLEREKLTKLVEERKRIEEEERKRRERIKLERIELKNQIDTELRRRQQEANRLAEEAWKKEQAELKEKKRLEAISNNLKDNWTDFKQVLDNNDIQYLYHFTDKRNIPSIKSHGGLFSWYYCKKNNITIPYQGGDDYSQELDKRYGLEDYVRLSFCNDHPMIYRLQQSGRDIVYLKIKTDVVLLETTLFSNINAADKLHIHGGQLEDLKRINFNATKRKFVPKDDIDFKPHQAEVLVKTFIPKKYIVNLDNIEL